MRKFLFWTIAIMLSILFISFVIIEGLVINEGRKTTSEKVDYIIVLGARLYGDMPSPALLERLKVAYKYSKENENVKIVVSGGQGSGEYVSEAYAMEKYLVDNGIESTRIIKEDKSTTTFENLKISLGKIREVDDSEDIKILISTNKYHVFRAKLLAKRLGIAAYGLPAEIPPTIVFHSYVREYFAIIKSFFFDW